MEYQKLYEGLLTDHRDLQRNYNVLLEEMARLQSDNAELTSKLSKDANWDENTGFDDMVNDPASYVDKKPANSLKIAHRMTEEEVMIAAEYPDFVEGMEDAETCRDCLKNVVLCACGGGE